MTEDSLLPPREWPPLKKAEALLARRYQIVKTAEWGHCKFADTILEDMIWESGLLCAYVEDAVKIKDDQSLDAKDKKEVSEWVIRTANEWLLRSAKENNVEMRMCEGDPRCGRVTCVDENGKFICAALHKFKVSL